MTIDEAIEHCEKTCKFHKKGKIYEEHYYVKKWLEELKELREYIEKYHKGMEYAYSTYMYRKAIDDFAEKIAIYGTYDDYGNVVDVLEIAEKLKKE